MIKGEEVRIFEFLANILLVWPYTEFSLSTPEGIFIQKLESTETFTSDTGDHSFRVKFCLSISHSIYLSKIYTGSYDSISNHVTITYLKRNTCSS